MTSYLSQEEPDINDNVYVDDRGIVISEDPEDICELCGYDRDDCDCCSTCDSSPCECCSWCGRSPYNCECCSECDRSDCICCEDCGYRICECPEEEEEI